ncbi:hypothetical protein C922_05222 [Plasmodium inui San Antonio 1]|uniref:Uncharacterized protein n=1 Tax=Plasmodium inui San Antonio 1 TaxID=1237626 RepID=W7AGG5_9APIC|nr:hypothetical protein C922_05222 [Plasmodium inui San Antonio 1]EUD64401.1 hypothetical protein C922_05222 [Plasmodium inui San Antonio 1]
MKEDDQNPKNSRTPHPKPRRSPESTKYSKNLGRDQNRTRRRIYLVRRRQKGKGKKSNQTETTQKMEKSYLRRKFREQPSEKNTGEETKERETMTGTRAPKTRTQVRSQLRNSYARNRNLGRRNPIEKTEPWYPVKAGSQSYPTKWKEGQQGTKRVDLH